MRFQDGVGETTCLSQKEECNRMYTLHYDSPLGGILLEDPDEENTAADLQLAEAAQQTAQNGTYGTAMLYYAFDDTVNSSRYPNYAYMQSYWTSVGLDTKLDTTVTVADLRRMNKIGRASCRERV